MQINVCKVYLSFPILFLGFILLERTVFIVTQPYDLTLISNFLTLFLDKRYYITNLKMLKQYTKFLRFPFCCL